MSAAVANRGKRKVTVLASPTVSLERGVASTEPRSPPPPLRHDQRVPCTAFDRLCSAMTMFDDRREVPPEHPISILESVGRSFVAAAEPTTKGTAAVAQFENERSAGEYSDEEGAAAGPSADRSGGALGSSDRIGDATVHAAVLLSAATHTAKLLGDLRRVVGLAEEAADMSRSPATVSFLCWSCVRYAAVSHDVALRNRLEELALEMLQSFDEMEADGLDNAMEERFWCLAVSGNILEAIDIGEQLCSSTPFVSAASITLLIFLHTAHEDYDQALAVLQWATPLYPRNILLSVASLLVRWAHGGQRDPTGSFEGELVQLLVLVQSLEGYCFRPSATDTNVGHNEDAWGDIDTLGRRVVAYYRLVAAAGLRIGALSVVDAAVSSARELLHPPPSYVLPTHPDTELLNGLCVQHAALLKARGQPMKAIHVLQGALRQAPQDEWVNAALGQLLVSSEEWEEAASHLTTALTANPRNATALEAYAMVQLQHYHDAERGAELMVAAAEVSMLEPLLPLWWLLPFSPMPF